MPVDVFTCFLIVAYQFQFSFHEKSTFFGLEDCSISLFLLFLEQTESEKNIKFIDQPIFFSLQQKLVKSSRFYPKVFLPVTFT